MICAHKIVLTASVETIMERMADRGMDKLDKWFANNVTRIIYNFDYIVKCSNFNNMYVVETDGKSIDEVVSECLTILI